MRGRKHLTIGGRARRRRTNGAASTTAAAVVLAVTTTLGAGIVGVQALAGSSSASTMAMSMPMAAASGTTTCTAGGPTPAHSSFTEQLVVPPKVDRRGGGTVNLVMRAGTHRFSAELPAASTFGYGLSTAGAEAYGGPTIEAKKGVPVKLTVANKLGPHPLAPYIDSNVMGTHATDAVSPQGTVHLHGAHSEMQFDGLPNSTFSPGQVFSYTYGNDQDATGLWYHDHAWGIVRLQVTAGLAGQYWLRDSYDTGNANNPLALPTGKYELPLTIQDRTFNRDGSLGYPVGAHCGLVGPLVDVNGHQGPVGGAVSVPADYPNQWSPESFGDVATVNGKIEPNLTVDRGVYRFRVLNGSNARFYNLYLAAVDPTTGTVPVDPLTGAPSGATKTMFQIGSDGGLLNTPAPVSQVRLAPAERADLLIDFSSLPVGSTWRLVNDAPAPDPGGGDVNVPQVMQFTVGRTSGLGTGIPASLRGGPNRPALLPRPLGAADSDAAPPGIRAGAPALKATSTRTIFLNEISDDLEVPGLAPTDPPVINGEPVHVMVGNQFYGDPATMQPRTTKVEAPALNSVEEWDIVNTTGDAHPIHLHMTQFRVLNRQRISTDPVSGDSIYVAERLNCGGAHANPASCARAPGLPNPEIAGTGPWPAPTADRYLIGSPTRPEANESGWKDTIVTLPGTVTRIVVPFGGTAAGIPAPYIGDARNAAIQHFTGTYVFHCHILEHEDNDMMSPLKIG